MNIQLKVLKTSLDKYNYIHFVDSDVVFLKELDNEYYIPYESYDVVYQRDKVGFAQYFHTWACLGNVVMRNTKATHTLLDEIDNIQAKHPEMNDQHAQQELFKSKGILDIRSYPYAKLYEFPETEISCGYNIIHNNYNLNKLKIVHANYVIGEEEKIKILKKIGYWY
jgi:hypothetical protein